MFEKRYYMDGISLDMLEPRRQNFEKKLPAYENLTDEQLEVFSFLEDVVKFKERRWPNNHSSTLEYGED
jgi:hypothetical protein